MLVKGFKCRSYDAVYDHALFSFEDKGNLLIIEDVASGISFIVDKNDIVPRKKKAKKKNDELKL